MLFDNPNCPSNPLPQAKISALSVSTKEWNSPHAIYTILLSLSGFNTVGWSYPLEPPCPTALYCPEP